MKRILTLSFTAAMSLLLVTGCLTSRHGGGGPAGAECPGTGSVRISFDGKTYNLSEVEGVGSEATEDGTVTVIAAPRNGQYPRVNLIINYSNTGTFDLGTTKPGDPMQIQGQLTIITEGATITSPVTFTTVITETTGSVTFDEIDFSCGGKVKGTFNTEAMTSQQAGSIRKNFTGSFTFHLNNFAEGGV
ncbi:MAG: hypothetical protein KF690_07780 [Bacteroidetes bacterium]|nr:hypothetical protein [Bacteroidota bacterium]